MRWLLVSISLVILPFTLVGEVPVPQPGWDGVTAIKLTLRPAHEPVPALKYRLLPSVAQMQAGNAALAYGRVRDMQWNRWRISDPELNSQRTELANLRLKDLPDRKEWNFFTQVMHPTRLADLRRAAHTDHCDWDLLSRIRGDGMGMVLLDIWGMQDVGIDLAFHARGLLAEQRTAEALDLVTIQFAMARHVGNSPVLMAALSGNEVINRAIGVLEDCLEQADCPNLYWALAELPRPLFDWRQAFQGEKMVLTELWHDLERELRERSLSSDQFSVHMQRTLDRLVALHAMREAEVAFFQLALATQAAAEYPAAKEELLQAGKSAAEVEAMAVGQIGLLRYLRRAEVLEANVMKWVNLPFAEAEAGLERQEVPSPSIIDQFRFRHLAPPRILHILVMRENLDRRLAALRCLEAIRMHAAEAGKLPATLAEIRCVPVPNDPALARPFDYQRTATGFTLRAEPFTRAARAEMRKSGILTPQVSMNYEITFLK